MQSRAKQALPGGGGDVNQACGVATSNSRVRNQQTATKKVHRVAAKNNVCRGGENRHDAPPELRHGIGCGVAASAATPSKTAIKR